MYGLTVTRLALRSVCLCFPCPGIRDMHHCIQLDSNILFQIYIFKCLLQFILFFCKISLSSVLIIFYLIIFRFLIVFVCAYICAYHSVYMEVRKQPEGIGRLPLPQWGLGIELRWSVLVASASTHYAVS